MHEMSIAVQIVDQVVELAGQNNATRIDEVVVEIGLMQLVVPEALEMAFSVATESTLAEGARLKIVEQEIEAVCRDCDHRYKPRIDCYLCPQCGQANARIVAGNDIILKSVVCETEQEAQLP
ncbi:MAG: hydrogenase maturation nickel metallochaperone HypA [Planctomycetota bacterium]|nr:MAG: hydrogenase maturation nickel metallochaperone HypA [Planctomycetota bacterium]